MWLGSVKMWAVGSREPDGGEGQAALPHLLPTPSCSPPLLRLFFLPAWLGVEKNAPWASPSPGGVTI